VTVLMARCAGHNWLSIKGVLMRRTLGVLVAIGGPILGLLKGT
jgi:hypothetical protein